MKNRVVATALLMLFLVDVFRPTAVMALSGGPDQPEFSSFTPFSADDFVDPFTGDFNYNLPLLVIPGYKEGYPINLSYSSGISPEQEASWVGLGWNLNPGAISRNLRGLPDEFNASDAITVERSMKPSVTNSINIGSGATATEALGVETSDFGLGLGANGSLTLSYNNYIGASYTYGFGVNVAMDNANSISPSFGLNGSLGPDGLTLTPSLSASRSGKNKKGTIEGGVEGSLSMSVNSNSGVQNIGFNMRPTLKLNKPENRSASLNFGNVASGGISFAQPSAPPFAEFPKETKSITGQGQFGVAAYGVTLDGALQFTWSKQDFKKSSITYKPYGYLHSQERTKGESMMDFNRHNDVQATGNSKVISAPQATPDLWSVSNQFFSANVRAYRNDVGVYKDPEVKSSGTGHTTGAEADYDPPANGLKASLNNIGNRSKSYSGPWQNAWKDPFHKTYDFKQVGQSFFGTPQMMRDRDIVPNDANDYLEPYYFMADDEFALSGEQAFSSSALTSVNAIAPRMTMLKSSLLELSASTPISAPSYQGATTATLPSTRQNRQPRSKVFQFLTWDDMKSLPNVDVGTLPPHVQVNHFKQVNAVTADGDKFIYGEPLYVLEDKEVSFSVDEQGNDLLRTCQYQQGDNSTGNSRGTDNFYNSVAKSPYISKILLSKIVSDDYYDTHNNSGNPLDPSLDFRDAGEWVNFDYTSVGTKAFRNPVSSVARTANYSPGNFEDPGDDKASYTYGVKQTAYLSEITTKTHKAIFYTSNRFDNLGTVDEDGTLDTTRRAKQLDKIELYTIDTNGVTIKLLKTIQFNYDYILCFGTENSIAPVPDPQNYPAEYPSNAGGTYQNGKLTLLSVEVLAGPELLQEDVYSFRYNGLDANDVPYQYSDERIDRWGTYQSLRFDGVSSYLTRFPYTNQIPSSYGDNFEGDAYSLSQVTLPTGGTVNIEYESDEYRFVEDKYATSMYRIAGFSDNPNTLPSDASRLQGREWVFVRLPAGIDPTTNTNYTPARMVDGIKDMFFKVYMNLKNKEDFSGMAKDYVEGYAEIVEAGSNWIEIPAGSGNYHAAIRLKNVSLDGRGGSAHPIRKASWQNLRYRRPDLFRKPNTAAGAAQTYAELVAVYPVFLDLFKEMAKILVGYYKWAQYNYAFTADLGATNKPSFVKLNAYNFTKKGGGIRVKKLWLDDSWGAMTGVNYGSHIHGTEYFYEDQAGNCSGVASYEPLVGSEEIPHKQPLRYGLDAKFSARDNAFYLDDPVLEAFYPNPQVGYERVIARPISEFGNIIDPADIHRYYVNKGGYSADNFDSTRAAIHVHEFHTAREFPVKLRRSRISTSKHTPPIVTVPFIGQLSVAAEGHSQGFSVEINDMHGKPLRNSTYPFQANIASLRYIAPTNKEEFFYNLNKPFRRGVLNSINPNVTAQFSDGTQGGFTIVPGGAPFGMTTEFYATAREAFAQSQSVGGAVNAHIWFIPPAFPIIIPSASVSMWKAEQLYRELSTMKEVRKKAVLLEKRVTANQSLSVERSNFFDAYTGAPTRMTQTNGFDEEVLNYTFAGHQLVPELRPQYKDLNKVVHPLGIFNQGDLMALMKIYWKVFLDGGGSSYQGNFVSFWNDYGKKYVHLDNPLNHGDLVLLKGVDAQVDAIGNITGLTPIERYLWVRATSSAPHVELIDENGTVYTLPSFSTALNVGAYNPNTGSITSVQIDTSIGNNDLAYGIVDPTLVAPYIERVVEMNTTTLTVIEPAEHNKLNEQLLNVTSLDELCDLGVSSYGTGSLTSFIEGFEFNSTMFNTIMNQGYDLNNPTIITIPGHPSTNYDLNIQINLSGTQLHVHLIEKVFSPTNIVAYDCNYYYDLSQSFQSGSENQYRIVSSSGQQVTFGFPNNPPSNITSIITASSLCPDSECLSSCLINPDLCDECIGNLRCASGILASTGVEYYEPATYVKDSYNDLDLSALPTGLNQFTSGKDGRVYPLKSNVYRHEMRQATPSNDISNPTFDHDGSKDGVYDGWKFPEVVGANAYIDVEWINKSTTTQVSSSGLMLEQEDAAGIPSTIQYNNDLRLVDATCTNCNYREFGYESFESFTSSYTASTSTSTDSRLLLTSGTLSTTESHSGERSLLLPSTNSTDIRLDASTGPTNGLVLQSGTRYVASFWVKINPVSQFGIAHYDQNNLQVFNNVYTYDQLSENAIDGWVRIEQTFTYDGAPGYLELTPYSGNAYIDDLRIYPVDGLVRSYVYNDYRKPAAMLDENNYATFYRYNSRQDLVTINKETTEGIYTVQTGYKYKRNR